MANLALNWVAATGTPPNRAPDGQKIFVHYRDVRQPSLDREIQEGVDSDMYTVSDGGKWMFTIKSKCEGEFSQGSASESIIVDGTLVDPGEGGAEIPAGVEDIPAPEMLSITPGA